MTSHHPTIPPPRSPSRTRRVVALGAATLALATVPAGVAQAEQFLDLGAANRSARHYVAERYANTHRRNLITACRPQGRPYQAGYSYSAWVCRWRDVSDSNEGRVIITGAAGYGRYRGRVLNGARVVP